MLKNELKERIKDCLNFRGFYKVEERDNIDNRVYITIDGTKYNIYCLECDWCGDEEKYITIYNDIKELKEVLVDYNYLFDINDYTFTGTICHNCFDNNYTYCRDCGDITRIEDCYTTYDGDYICDNCYNDYYFTCDSCGNVFNRDCMIYNEEEDTCLCDECYSNNYFKYGDYDTTKEEIIGNIEEESSVSAVLGYHHNTLPFTLHKLEEEDTKLYYGVELESSINDYQKMKNASCFIAKNLNCRIEEDGSVCGYPMEIISDPQTINYWTSRRSKIAKIFQSMIDYGITSHNNNTCGLHIHVSRSGLGDTNEEQERVINNIILILENFKSNLIKLSRRNEEQLKRWGCFLSDFDNNTEDLRNIDKIKKNYHKYDRYTALNLNNPKTIEFRFFRGTLNIDTFYSTLYLVNNIIELAKNEDIIGTSFKKLITLNNHEELIKYAKEKECDNSIIIVDKSSKINEMLERKTKLKKYVRYTLLKKEIDKYFIDNIEDFSNYDYMINNSSSIIQNILVSTNEYVKYQVVIDTLKELYRLLNYTNDIVDTNNHTYYYNDNLKNIRDKFNELKSLKGVI